MTALECNDLSTAIWLYDIDHFRIMWANSAAVALWNASSSEELLARDFKPETSDAVRRTLLDYRESFKRGEVISRFWSFFPKGEQKDAFCQMSGYTLADGRTALLCEATQITSFSDRESFDGIAILSNYEYEGRFISANPPFIEQHGKRITHFLELFVDAAHAAQVLFDIQRKKQYIGDILLNTAQGEQWFHLHARVSEAEGERAEIIVQQFNIHERKLEQINLSHQVVSDSLTGLLNRRGLSDALGALIAQQTPFLVCYLDLDGFKMVNDSLGHACGDAVLVETSQRLKQYHPSAAIACRVGGDEFIWAVPLLAELPGSTELAQGLLLQMRESFRDADGKALPLSCSIGTALYPADASDLEQLLQYADAAMYMAKAQGKNRLIGFVAGMQNSLRRHSVIARHLAVAIEKSELSVHYQPVFDLSSGQVYSFEALLRWEHPDLGLISAQETVNIAQRIGCINQIELWVANRAIRDLALLRRYAGESVKVSINLCGTHVVDCNLAGNLESLLKGCGLSGQDLIVELSEGALAASPESVAAAMTRLISCGIELCLDDFGKGLSALAQLHKVAAKSVKIDALFTALLASNSATIRSMHQLLQGFGLSSVAGGVETLEQSRQLMDMGVCLQQGYALGAPQPLQYYFEKVCSAEPKVASSLIPH
ncbi:MAG: EAL domain-containing protein [Pseudomonadales bacterium]